MALQKKSLLVTASDTAFLEGTKGVFSSAIIKGHWKGDIMLIVPEGTPDAALSWFRERGILIRKYPLIIKKAIRGHPPIIFSRFYVFKEEFQEWKSVIYLDADTIIMRPLNKLRRIKGFYAVPDYKQGLGTLRLQFRERKGPLKKEYDRLLKDYNLDALSFNSGFFSFSTDIIREDTFDKLVVLLHKYKGVFKWQDQSILNLMFYKRWKALPFLFNNTIPLDPLSEKGWLDGSIARLRNRNSYVLHFADFKGPYKPWMEKSPYHDEWVMMIKQFEKGKKPANKRALPVLTMISYRLLLFAKKASDDIDRRKGMIGLKLKRISPSLYSILGGKNI